MKRYDFHWDGMERDDDEGEYVSAADYDALAAHAATLEARMIVLESALAQASGKRFSGP